MEESVATEAVKEYDIKNVRLRDFVEFFVTTQNERETIDRIQETIIRAWKDRREIEGKESSWTSRIRNPVFNPVYFWLLWIEKINGKESSPAAIKNMMPKLPGYKDRPPDGSNPDRGADYGKIKNRLKQLKESKKIGQEDETVGHRLGLLVEELANTDFSNNFAEKAGEIYKAVEYIFRPFDTDTIKKIKERIEAMSVESQIKKLIETGGIKQIILTGAPGTGKTRMAKNVAKQLAEETGALIDGKPYKLVQFHPSYDYTDFVEGLRPVERLDSDGKSSMQFLKLDGTFKAFCRRVTELNKAAGKAEDGKDVKALYFFIIDEINRADLSKVFGELMLCLENDKRGEKDGDDNDNLVQTQYQHLPTYDIRSAGFIKNDVFARGFYIPRNVIVIGTMNDIDRSVESIDFAMRRRFEWREIKVEENSFKAAIKGIFKGVIPEKLVSNIEGLADGLWEHVDALNKVIESEGAAYGLNKHYYISQGYFANITYALKSAASLEEVVSEIAKCAWDYRIKSLLNEYVRGERDTSEFLENCENALTKPYAPKVVSNAAVTADRNINGDENT